MSSRLPAPPVLLPAMLPLISALPLRGLTVLAVEDSRYACEALRLMCQRSGARLRRAESLAAAASHLGTYRPDLVLVDLGLPDGRGEDLIRALCRAGGPLVLGMSGDPEGAGLAMKAGAAGFFGKPLPDLAGFQAAILSHLGDRSFRGAPFSAGIAPDPLSLRDDLRKAEAALKADPATGKTRDWLRGFLAGLALQTGDPVLSSVAEAIGRLGRDRLASPPGSGAAENLPPASFALQNHASAKPVTAACPSESALAGAFSRDPGPADVILGEISQIRAVLRAKISEMPAFTPPAPRQDLPGPV